MVKRFGSYSVHCANCGQTQFAHKNFVGDVRVSGACRKFVDRDAVQPALHEQALRGLMEVSNGIYWRAKTGDPDTQASGDTQGGSTAMAYPNNPGEGAAAGESSGLEVVNQPDPIRAWRGLRLVAVNNTVELQSLNFGPFSAQETAAQCDMWSPYATQQMQSVSFMYAHAPGGARVDPRIEAHAVPNVACECGFYGVKDRKDCQGTLFAEVDLYGRVIEHELGYRAEYQRVLSVRIKRPPHCGGGFLCDGVPDWLWFPTSDGGYVDPTVVCEGCAKLNLLRAAPLSHVAARLGVEVRWDDVE